MPYLTRLIRSSAMGSGGVLMQSDTQLSRWSAIIISPRVPRGRASERASVERSSLRDELAVCCVFPPQSAQMTSSCFEKSSQDNRQPRHDATQLARSKDAIGRVRSQHRTLRSAHGQHVYSMGRPQAASGSPATVDRGWTVAAYGNSADRGRWYSPGRALRT